MNFTFHFLRYLNERRSPLGFSELFNEFRLQENLHSLDDILNAIIDSEGMSFNDLKPIYKEFLLKLAVTLTKDELYQRSKSIMRRQKKKLMQMKKNSTAPYQVSSVHLFISLSPADYSRVRIVYAMIKFKAIYFLVSAEEFIPRWFETTETDVSIQ